MTEQRATVHLDIDPFAAPAAPPVEIRARPFELVVMGDFSGRESRGEHRTDSGISRALAVDRDDFDAVLNRLSPRIRLALDPDAPAMEIELRELDDFHPDGLFERAPLFGHLRNLRRRAMDPRELTAVAAELGMGPAPQPPGPTGVVTSGGNLLDQILEVANPGGAPSIPSPVDIARGGELSDVVRRLVAPHLVARPDPRQAEIVSSIDAAVGEGMRKLLHHPSFQALESLWRSLYLLVRGVETGSLLRIRIVDITRAELEADLAPDTRAGGRLRQLLSEADGAPAEVGPALLVAVYSAGASERDLTLLGRLAELGQAVGAPCLAGGHPGLVGAEDSAALTEPEKWTEPPEGWAELRGLSAARYLGVALPGFLLRMPYGEESDECEAFPFEEMSDPPRHEEYLWGNAAVGCAMLLARGFSAAGWQLRPGQNRDLDGLPLPLVRTQDGVTAQPAAEVWLSEATAERILDAGVMPLASIRDQGAARLVRFQSIAAPLAPLAGRWTSA